MLCGAACAAIAKAIAEHVWNQSPSLAVCPEVLSSNVADISELLRRHLGL